MRLHLDEMFRTDLAELLRLQGHDVVRTADVGLAAADDAQILQCATGGGRILITLDEHFGDWAILPLGHHPGVIRLKIHPTTTANAWALLVPFLAAHAQEELKDHLVIISRSSERWIHTAEGT